MDTNKEILDLLKNDQGKLDGVSKDVKEAKAEVLRIEAANKVEVERLNGELAKKDATLKDIQDAVNELKAKGGKSTAVKASQIDMRNPEHVKGLVYATIEANKEEFNSLGKGSKEKMESKMITKASPILSGNLTGNPYFDYLPAAPGQRPFGQTRFRDLAPTYQSDTDYVLYPVQVGAPLSGTFNYQQTEGVAKAQLDYSWKNVQLNLKAFAGYAKVSRQSLRNIPFLQSYLPMNLMEDLLDQEDLDFGNDLYTQATGSTSNTGSNGSPIEDVTIYLKNLLKTKYSPSGVAIDPDKWAEILLTKPGSTVTNYSLPAVASIDQFGMVRLLGKPLYPVNWLTGGKVIVGDWSRTGIVESEGLTMRQTDSDQDDFVKNLMTFLLEKVQGLAIFHPNAFIATTVS